MEVNTKSVTKMIRFTFILSALFLALNVSYAQSNDNLKGPAAKNQKPWQKQSKDGVILVMVDDKANPGPQHKNAKPWRADQTKLGIQTSLVVRERVTGPKAKNQRPWKKENPSKYFHDGFRF